MNTVMGYVKNGSGAVVGGAIIDLDNLAQTLTYTTGNLTAVAVTVPSVTLNNNTVVTNLVFTQTLTYTTGNLTGTSQWLAVVS